MKETLCWDCKNATGGCSWSDEFKPVKGWKAKPTTVYDSHYTMCSYHVEKCPEFVSDKKVLLTNEKIASILSVNPRTPWRWAKSKIINKLAKHGIKASYNKKIKHFYGEFVE